MTQVEKEYQKEGVSMKIQIINSNSSVSSIISWIFGIAFFVIGVLNVFLVHPVPGVFYLLLSFVYFPPTNDVLMERVGFSIPLVVKIILGLAVVWFTLGVSDLAELSGL